MRMVAIVALGMMAAAAPAMAAERTGFQAISAGNLPMAERQIDAAMRANPGRPELMLNLAAVYLETGRDAEARALYSTVLREAAVAMDMPSGAVMSSHDVALRGLERLPHEAIATR